jgi:hypothetical protein
MARIGFSALLAAVAFAWGGPRTGFLPEARAEAFVCGAVATVLKEAAESCKTEIVTNPIRCMKRLWEQNKPIVDATVAAARSVWKDLGPTLSGLATGIFDKIKEFAEGELGVDPNHSLARNLANIAWNGLRLTSELFGVPVRLGAALIAYVTSKLMEAFDRAAAASPELRNSAELQELQARCGQKLDDSGGCYGLATCNQWMQGSCGKYSSSPLDFDASALEDKLRAGKDCVANVWKALNAGVRCATTAGILAMRNPSVVAGTVAEAGRIALEELSRAGQLLESAWASFKQAAATKARAFLSGAAEVLKNALIAGAQKYLADMVAKIMAPSPGPGPSPKLEDGLRSRVKAEAKSLLRAGIDKLVAALKPEVNAFVTAAIDEASGGCVECACVLGAVKEVVLGTLLDAFVESLVDRVVDELTPSDATLLQAADALLSSLGDLNLGGKSLKEWLQGLFSRLAAGGSSGSNIFKTLPDVLYEPLRRVAPGLREMADGILNAFLAALGQGKKMSDCQSSLSNGKYLAALGCAVDALKEAAASAGAKMINAALKALLDAAKMGSITDAALNTLRSLVANLGPGISSQLTPQPPRNEPRSRRSGRSDRGSGEGPGDRRARARGRAPAGGDRCEQPRHRLRDARPLRGGPPALPAQRGDLRKDARDEASALRVGARQRGHRPEEPRALRGGARHPGCARASRSRAILPPGPPTRRACLWTRTPGRGGPRASPPSTSRRCGGRRGSSDSSRGRPRRRG